MEKLSVEILRDIISYIDSKRDLQNLRLVQRSFANVTNEFLFRVINIVPPLGSTSSIRELSHRKDLAQYVKELVVHIYSWVDFAWTEYCEAYRTSPHIAEEDLEIHKAYLFEEYLRKDRAVFGFQGTPEYTVLLSESFQGFPNLKSARIAVDPSFYQADYWDYRRNDKTIEHLKTLHGTDGDIDDMNSFSAVVNAAYTTGLELTSFSANFSAELLTNSELGSRAASVFRNCRALELIFNGCAKMVPPLRNGAIGNPFLSILSPAVHLEELKIRFWDDTDYTEVLPMNYLGKKHVWPRLKTLFLEDRPMEIHVLTDLLRRHKKTLRKVALRATLQEGFWLDVALFMKRELDLTEVSFIDYDVRSEHNHILLDEKYYYCVRGVKKMVDYVLNREIVDISMEMGIDRYLF